MTELFQPKSSLLTAIQTMLAGAILCVSSAVFAHDMFSMATLYKIEGNLIYRPSTEFSQEAHKYYQERRETLSNLYPTFVLSQGDQLAAQLIQKLILDLAKKSGVESKLSNPNPVFVVITKADDFRGTPEASMDSGVLTINKTMIDMIENDDELAEVVGHELLHHLLSHSLALRDASETLYYRTLKKMGSGGDMGFGGGQSSLIGDISGELATSYIKGKRAELEEEVRLATPTLLVNAGYNPWSMVTMKAKELEHSYGRSERFYSTENRNDLNKFIKQTSADLRYKRIEDKETRSTQLITKLKALLSDTHEAGR